MCPQTGWKIGVGEIRLCKRMPVMNILLSRGKTLHFCANLMNLYNYSYKLLFFVTLKLKSDKFSLFIKFSLRTSNNLGGISPVDGVISPVDRVKC